MARAVSMRRKLTMTALVWLVALIMFFPILYTIITSLKTEGEAAAGFSMIPSFTFESYAWCSTSRTTSGRSSTR